MQHHSSTGATPERAARHGMHPQGSLVQHLPGARSPGPQAQGRGSVAWRSLPPHANEQQQAAGANSLQEKRAVLDPAPLVQPPPFSWREVMDGRLWDASRQGFPAVPWDASALVKVLGGTAAGLLVAGTLSSTVGGAGLPVPQAATPEQVAALAHAAREGALLAATAAILSLSLGGARPRQAGLFCYALSPAWAGRTALVCLVLFPVADPVLATLGEHAATGLLGDAWGAAGQGAEGLASSVRGAAAEGDTAALGLHLLASGLLGPLWEETFWRGFFLTSLTRVLPLPACVALSSAWFAALHLRPAAFLPIWLLAAAGDALYLRTASLGPPLALHAAWNVSQVLAVAYLGKTAFV